MADSKTTTMMRNFQYTTWIAYLFIFCCVVLETNSADLLDIRLMTMKYTRWTANKYQSLTTKYLLIVHVRVVSTSVSVEVLIEKWVTYKVLVNQWFCFTLFVLIFVMRWTPSSCWVYMFKVMWCVIESVLSSCPVSVSVTFKNKHKVPWIAPRLMSTV